MNYRFENNFTHADQVKWNIIVSKHRCEAQMSMMPAIIVVCVQFTLWVGVFYILNGQDIPFGVMATILFIAFMVIGSLYDSLIMPHVAAIFDKAKPQDDQQNLSSIIEINDDEIRACENDFELIFRWDDIQKVVDTETTVILMTKNGHCLIPAKCFPGFLEKDAFVRECREKIFGLTPQGRVFT